MTKPKKKAASKRRAAGEGGLFLRADGMWCGVVDVPTVDGKRDQKRVYSKDHGKAVEKLRILKDNISKGIIPSSSMTVGRWLPHWLETIKRPHVRPNTYDFYEEAVRLHIVPHIGKKRLDRLTPEDVRAMIRQANTSRNAQRAHQTLSMALKDAMSEGLLGRNVCDAVKKPGHLATSRGAMQLDDAKKIIRTAIDLQESRDESGTEPLVATRWASAFLTGARPAEILGLEWNRVDLDNAIFDFAWQLQQLKQVHGCGPADPDGAYPCKRTRPGYCPERRWNFENGFEYRECYRSLVWTRPKTKTGTRIVPIVAPLLEMLRQHAKIIGPNPHALVWHHRDGRPIAPKDDYKRWNDLLKAAEVPPAELYAARHTTATMLQEAGVAKEVRMQIMGHSSEAAHDGYIHVDQTQTRAALDTLAQLLG